MYRNLREPSHVLVMLMWKIDKMFNPVCKMAGLGRWSSRILSLEKHIDYVCRHQDWRTRRLRLLCNPQNNNYPLDSRIIRKNFDFRLGTF